jgi:hypothetical protein
VRLNWDTTTVVFDPYRAVRKYRYGNAIAGASHCFVNTIIEYLSHEMMQTANIGAADVHTWPQTHVFEALKDLDLSSIIFTS